MSPLSLLGLYCVALVVFSLAGGALPQRVQMTHTRTQLAMSLVSGLMLGIAFFHLLPHALMTLGLEQGLTVVMGWVVFGLIIMLLLLRLLHFHQPDYHSTGIADCAHEHAHAVPGAPVLTGHSVSWKGVLIGLGFHTLIDGIALGAAFLAAPHGHEGQLLAFGVFLAILMHKPLDAMSITALMKAGGASLGYQRWANIAFAIICPLGALLFYGYAVVVGPIGVDFVAAALAFSAGAFVCIALSDLLPEVQFHSHDRFKLTAVFLLGLGLSYLLATAGNEHTHAVASIVPL
ncbi:MAG: zinc and cadmium transporter [Halieaceae bacterium]|jgi:zinc and cadmium transporter